MNSVITNNHHDTLVLTVEANSLYLTQETKGIFPDLRTSRVISITREEAYALVQAITSALHSENGAN